MTTNGFFFAQKAEALRSAGLQRVSFSMDSLDPEQFKKFQEAQGALSSALSRLLVVTEQYPDLKATQAFRDLQVQLEGAENRITVERMRFNEVARDYNTKRNSFPTIVVAGLFGDKYREKPYFKAQEGADTVPKVKF